MKQKQKCTPATRLSCGIGKISHVLTKIGNIYIVFMYADMQVLKGKIFLAWGMRSNFGPKFG